MDTGEWITSAIAVLALIVAVAALLIAVRSAQHGHTVERAPDPVVATAAVAEAPAVPLPPTGVVWKIEHEAGITWTLRNIGTEPAYDVNAVGLPPESASLVKMRESFADIPAHGSVGFNVVRTAHHPNFRGLAVTWSGQTEPVIVSID